MWILVKNWVIGANITIIGDDVNFPNDHIQNMCSRHKQKSIEYQKAYLKKSAALECIEFRVGSAKSMPCCDTGE